MQINSYWEASFGQGGQDANQNQREIEIGLDLDIRDFLKSADLKAEAQREAANIYEAIVSALTEIHIPWAIKNLRIPIEPATVTYRTKKISLVNNADQSIEPNGAISKNRLKIKLLLATSKHTEDVAALMACRQKIAEIIAKSVLEQALSKFCGYDTNSEIEKTEDDIERTVNVPELVDHGLRELAEEWGVTPKKAAEMIAAERKPKSLNSLRREGVLLELRNQEIQEIADEFGITFDEVWQLIIRGLEMADELHTNDKFYQPFKINARRLRMLHGFSLELNKNVYAKLVKGAKDDKNYHVRIKSKTNDFSDQYTIRIRDNYVRSDNGKFCASSMPRKFIEISLEDDQTSIPCPNERVNYGLYDENGKLCAIFAFSKNPLDIDATDEKSRKHFSEGVYFRSLDRDNWEGKTRKERIAQLARHTETGIKTIETTNQALGIPAGFLDNMSLILNRNEFGKHGSMVRRIGASGKFHYTIIFTRKELEGENEDMPPENTEAQFRHEYIHGLDSTMGDKPPEKGDIDLQSDNFRYFSEREVDKLVEIVSRHLFNGAVIPMAENSRDPLWPNKELIDYCFAEHKVLATGIAIKDQGLPGHPNDDIKEFIASAVNCYLDPRFREAIAKRSGKELETMTAMYAEIMDLFNSRLREVIAQKAAKS